MHTDVVHRPRLSGAFGRKRGVSIVGWVPLLDGFKANPNGSHAILANARVPVSPNSLRFQSDGFAQSGTRDMEGLSYKHNCRALAHGLQFVSQRQSRILLQNLARDHQVKKKLPLIGILSFLRKHHEDSPDAKEALRLAARRESSVSFLKFAICSPDLHSSSAPGERRSPRQRLGAQAEYFQSPASRIEKLCSFVLLLVVVVVDVAVVGC